MKRKIVVRLDTTVVVEVDAALSLDGNEDADGVCVGDDIGWAVKDAAREAFRELFRPDDRSFSFSWSPHLDTFLDEPEEDSDDAPSDS
jgi:hypothetical protein